MKKPAYLFGPFVGELSWEFFRFAPYAIHMKKENPNISLIVFTRKERFDFYGNYANILVPLRIPNDENLTRDCFRLDNLSDREYNHIARTIKSKYKKRFDIINHYYPDISAWRYKVKWQFPRRMMDYDFKPREKNIGIAKKIVKRNNIIIDNICIDHCDIEETINSTDLFSKFSYYINNYDSTLLGCVIASLKRCKYVIGNLSSPLSHLAILLNKPLICINNKMSLDSINLLNPLKTPIIFEDDIKKGVEKYENNI